MSASVPGLTIVTGASAPYARCLWQMLRSAERRDVASGRRFVAFDLGIGNEEKALLARRFPWCLWRSLAFGTLPPHAGIAARTYAWKPLVIHAACAEFGGLLLWLDSATIFRGPPDEAESAIRRFGLYTLAGQSPIQDRCDPEVWEAVGAPLEILDRPERAAGVVGFDTDRPEARRLLEAWRDLALDPGVWRPLSARHRPEQALLSILVYRWEREGRLEPNPGEIDIGSTAPVRWISTRNKVPNGLPYLADPLARICYGIYKHADRLAIRLRRLKSQRLDGWHRYPKEHFRVFIGRAGGDRLEAVPAPRGSYYADPFLCAGNGSPWLFVEEFRYGRNSGRIVALPVGPGLKIGEARPVAIPGPHVSFPFIFDHLGRLHMIPESAANRTVDLYACDEFPRRWSLARRLLANVDAADSVVFRHEGRWWLFTSVRDTAGGHRRYLAIFHTEDILHGALQPHPVNAERRNAGDLFSSGRCAGPVLRGADGGLIRPVQRSRRYYGEGVELMRIVVLTPESFEERALEVAHPLAALASQVSPHHVCIEGGLVACDVRDRVSYLQNLPVLRRLGLSPGPRAAGLSGPIGPGNASGQPNFRGTPDRRPG